MTINRVASRTLAGLGVLLIVLALSVLLNAKAIFGERAPNVQLDELRMDRLSKFILSLDISGDSSFVAAALSDLHVHIWKLSSGESVRDISFTEPAEDPHLRLAGDSEPMTVKFSPDSKVLAVSFLSKIYLYDARTWQRLSEIGLFGEDDLWPELQKSLAATELKTRTGQQADEGKRKPPPSLDDRMKQISASWFRGDGRSRITDFSFDSSGDSILAAYCRGSCFASPGRHIIPFPSGKDVARLWDLRTLHITWEHSYNSKGTVTRLVISPDGVHFAAVQSFLGTCSVGIHRLRDGILLNSLPPTPSPLCDPPQDIAFLPDGASFITNNAEPNDKNRRPWKFVSVFSTASTTRLADWPQHDDIRFASISSDGKWLASALWSGLRFQIRDVATGRVELTESPREWKLRGPAIDRVLFSPDGKWLLAGSDETGELAVYRFSFSEGSARGFRN